MVRWPRNVPNIFTGTEHKPHPVPYRKRVIAERYGYLADVTFQLQVWGDNTPVRNRMVDEITSAFLRFRKNALLNRGIKNLFSNNFSIWHASK